MAPQNQAQFAKDEKVLCFHHEMLYEGKILEVKHSDPADKKSPYQYRIHYKGWKNTWDDWVPDERLRKLTEDNKELAANIKREYESSRQRAAPKQTTGSSKKRGLASDLSSGRGSEDRHSSVPAGGRSTKRGRDYEIEKNRRNQRVTTPVARGRKSKYNLRSGNPASGGRRGRSVSPQGGYEADGEQSPPKKISEMTAMEILARTPSPEIPLDPKRFRRPLPETYRLPISGTHYLDLPRRNRGLATTGDALRCQEPKLTTAGRASWSARGFLSESDFRDFNNNYVDCEQEDQFYTRPSVRIVIPDILKAFLVDDWENITKNLQLVPVPSKAPVNFILDSYFDEEKGKRRLGSAEADLLEEVVAGLKEYFALCLGRLLLYRFEREQFYEVRQLWEGGNPDWEGKNAGDAYGAEHLCRLFAQMPGLIAQTNMDRQSVNRMREELSKMTMWLSKNHMRFFCASYENATQEYIEKARGV